MGGVGSWMAEWMDTELGRWVIMRNTECGCMAALWRGTEPNTWVLVPDLILTSVTLDHFFYVSKSCPLIGKEDAGPCPAYKLLGRTLRGTHNENASESLARF